MPPTDGSDIASQAARVVQAVNAKPTPGESNQLRSFVFRQQVDVRLCTFNTYSAAISHALPLPPYTRTAKIRAPISDFLSALAPYPPFFGGLASPILENAGSWCVQEGAEKKRSRLVWCTEPAFEALFSIAQD